MQDADFKSWTQVWDVSGPPRVLATLQKEYGGGLGALAPSGRRVVTGRAVVYDVDTGHDVSRLPDSIFSHGYFRDDDRFVFTQRHLGSDKPEKGRVHVWNV
ncbi:MAG TPA: hypothetical protein VD866_10390, partial [Urbifossiella sp.]|nr:hypothetical protein [Urbifossiella sp.]